MTRLSLRIFAAPAQDRCWPTTSDIAAHANVGCQGNCGSDQRALEASKMTQLRHRASPWPLFNMPLGPHFAQRGSLLQITFQEIIVDSPEP